jgi:hypothetical protein
VDIVLEALEAASPGEVLVIDNGASRDEVCIGDLTALEAKLAGLARLVIWAFTVTLWNCVRSAFRSLASARAPLDLVG